MVTVKSRRSRYFGKFHRTGVKMKFSNYFLFWGGINVQIGTNKIPYILFFKGRVILIFFVTLVSSK